MLSNLWLCLDYVTIATQVTKSLNDADSPEIPSDLLTALNNNNNNDTNSSSEVDPDAPAEYRGQFETCICEGWYCNGASQSSSSFLGLLLISVIIKCHL